MTTTIKIQSAKHTTYLGLVDIFTLQACHSDDLAAWHSSIADQHQTSTSAAVSRWVIDLRSCAKTQNALHSSPTPTYRNLDPHTGKTLRIAILAPSLAVFDHIRSHIARHSSKPLYARWFHDDTPLSAALDWVLE